MISHVCLRQIRWQHVLRRLLNARCQRAVPANPVHKVRMNYAMPFLAAPIEPEGYPKP